MLNNLNHAKIYATLRELRRGERRRVLFYTGNDSAFPEIYWNRVHASWPEEVIISEIRNSKLPVLEYMLRPEILKKVRVVIDGTYLDGVVKVSVDDSIPFHPTYHTAATIQDIDRFYRQYDYVLLQFVNNGG